MSRLCFVEVTFFKTFIFIYILKLSDLVGRTNCNGSKDHLTFTFFSHNQLKTLFNSKMLKLNI